jgi:hypothetical protein
MRSFGTSCERCTASDGEVVHAPFTPPRPPRTSPVATGGALRQDLVTRLLDDVNVLGEALVAALNGKDDVQAATVRALLDRHALAVSWGRDRFLPAILAYARELPEFDDDHFAPAFTLKSIAPDHPETADLLAKVPQDVLDLLARV